MMDLEKKLSRRAVELKPSGIRRFFDIANEMEGVISLGVGEPDFKTPYSVRRAGIENLQAGKTSYSANAGLMELRRSICRGVFAGAEGEAPMISVHHTSSYELTAVQEAVDRHFELLELEKKIPREGRITIKPNLLMKRRPEEGTTTHPALVEAIIRRIQQFSRAEIIIADSPGGPFTRPALEGIYRAEGKVCKGFDLIRPIAETDCIISVCKLKSHCMTGLSGGVKNLFGCIPGLTKPEFHWRYPAERDFCGMLLDLCQTVNPAVTFVDAVVSMEGDGPSSGELRKTGLTFCADNPYQLDLVLTRVIGREPAQIPLVDCAIERRGLCPLQAEEVPVCGDALLTFPDFRKPRSKTVDFISNVPKPLRGICRPVIRRYLTPRPQILTEKCVGCGKCAESCPAHTIEIVNKKARIDRSRCIQCYCCHEMCPAAMKCARFMRFG